MNNNVFKYLMKKRFIMKEIDSMDKYELSELKKDIENRLKKIKFIEKHNFNIIKKNKISEISKGDKILQIDFNGSNVLSVDYVNIETYDLLEDCYKGLTHFIITSENNNALGCSACFSNRFLDKEYFMVIFSSSIKFFTLRPENWEEDIKDSIKIITEEKQKNLKEEINSLVGEVNDFTKAFKIEEHINL